MIRFSIRSLPYRLRTARPEAFTFLYMIEYHTIFILKKQTASSKPFAAPSRKTPQGQQTKRRCGAAAPRALHPRGATQNASAGAKPTKFVYLHNFARDRGQKFGGAARIFWQKLFENAHFCYNSSKVPLCGGPARQTLKARCAFLSAFVTCKTMTRMVLLWPLRGDIML